MRVIKRIDSKAERRKRAGNGGVEMRDGGRSDEVELDGLGAGGVPEDGVDRRH